MLSGGADDDRVAPEQFFQQNLTPSSERSEEAAYAASRGLCAVGVLEPRGHRQDLCRTGHSTLEVASGRTDRYREAGKHVDQRDHHQQ